MPSPRKDSLIQVRAERALIDAAGAAARQRGMTLSELIRQAARREVQEAA